MYDPLDNPSLIDTSWIRQRGPVERNIYIRSAKLIEQDYVARKKADSALHMLIMVICAGIFGFSLMALYEHALTRNSNPFQSTQTTGE